VRGSLFNEIGEETRGKLKKIEVMVESLAVCVCVREIFETKLGNTHTKYIFTIATKSFFNYIWH
jgi:hypothetical protein